MNETLIQPSLQLDLRNIPPRERHAQIFDRFDELVTGEALQIVSDHNLQPLRYQIEDRAFGQFEWDTLEAGPAVWRIQFTRVTDAVAPSAAAKGESCCSGGACCG